MSRINAIGTAVPGHDIHRLFVEWAQGQITSPVERRLFDRMVKRSAIEHRHTVLPQAPGGGSPIEPGGFYHGDPLPPTSERMRAYAHYAPELALAAIADLEARTALGDITHLVVASCTGFVAPGIDQILVRRLNLPGSVERVLVGFMGCYAAITALRTARHISRSDPNARVLVVTVELCSLHLEPATKVESLLAMLQFADGAAAALVTSEGDGIAIEEGFSLTLPQSESLIRWDIGDSGFLMTLSGEVPQRIATALANPASRSAMTGGLPVEKYDGWAVHAGGRSILDAVESGLGLAPDALDASRGVLRDFGNMSSSTLMFVLARMFKDRPSHGIAIAFGPGLAAEGFRFGRGD